MDLIAIFLLESTFCVFAVALSLSTVKHGSFLFTYFLEQMKKLKNNLKNCTYRGCCLYAIYPTAVDQLMRSISGAVSVV